MKNSNRILRIARACVASVSAMLALGASADPQVSLSFFAAGAHVNTPVTLSISLSESGGLPISGGTLSLSYPNFRNTGVNSTTCAGATVTAANGTSTLSVTSINIVTSSFCQVTVEMQPLLSGTQLVTAPAGSAFANGAGQFNLGTSAASLCVEAPYVVTNTADSGPGSLRQAILDANAPSCASGLVADIKFSIPVAAGPAVQTIQPLSILPAITRAEGVNIDAYTQAGATRNTSPLGSGNNANLTVILNGSACTATCVGLQFASTTGTSSVSGLAVHSFNSHGIFVTGGSVLVTGNYIGTDPGGNNAFTSAKGIVAAGGVTLVGDGTPAGINLISGNQVGIDVSSTVSVNSNQVGGTRGGLPGLANGIGIVMSSGSGTVNGNLVRYNTNAGIQYDVQNVPVLLDGNASYGNGGPGIDILGDGATLNDASEADGIQNYPAITSVLHAGGNTIVSGTIQTSPGADGGGSLMQLFSNPTLPAAGRTEGQSIIFTGLMPTLDASGFGTFNLTIPGTHDFVSGTLYAGGANPRQSEFSPAVVAVAAASSVVATPGSLSFGPQAPNVVSTAQTITVSNTNISLVYNVTLVVSTNPAFSVSHLCSTLAPSGGSCSISVTFTAATTGPYGGTIDIATTDPAAPLIQVAVSGTVQAGALTFTPSTVNFGNQVQNTASGPQIVQMFNPTTVPVAITSIVAGGDFSVSHFCGTSLGPNTACNLNVTFTPSVIGVVNGTLTVTSDALSSPDVIALTGTGVAPAGSLTVSPTGLVFAPQTVGTPSAAQLVTLTNNGRTPITFSSIAFSGALAGFAVANGCGTSLAANATCTLSVTFTPTGAGAVTGSITITSTSNSSPDVVSLSGTGVAPVPQVGVTPGSLTFAARTVNTTSPLQTVTVQNTGTGPAIIASITVSGDFQATSLCGGSLAAAATCTVDVKFTPLVAGARTGTLSIVSDAPGSPHTVALSGIGIALPVGTLDVTPTSIDFGTLAPGATSPAQLVSVLNSGQSPVALSAAVSGAPFALATVPASVTACGATLNAGSACSYAVTYAPTANGTSAGTFTITSDASNPSVVVSLFGTAATVTPPRSLSVPARLDFGSQPLGLTTPGSPLAITNTGATTVSLVEATPTGDFAVSDGCTTIAPRATCTLLVTFTPSARGARSGVLTLRTATESQPYVVALSGDGGANPTPALSVSPARIGFGNALVGPPGAATSIDLVNVGEVPVVLGGFTVPGDFLVANRCPGTLAAGQRCQMDVRFYPRALGLRAGLLDVLSNAGNGPHRVEVSGVGCSLPSVARNRLPQLSCTP